MNWLETEYHQTIATANMAGKWQEFQETKDLYPNLKYVTAGDDRVRDKHKKWDGFIAPIDHPIWKKLYPPNDWACRCDVVPSDEQPAKGYREFEATVKTTFHNNPAITGKIFNEIPYEKNLTKNLRKEAKINIEEYAEKGDKTILFKNDFFKKNYDNETYLENDILSKLQQATIKHYTDISGHYEYLNHYLRTGKILPLANNENIGSKFITTWKNQLEKSLDKLPNYKGLVHRGTTLPREVFEQWQNAFEKGTPVTDKAFLSTTIDEDRVFKGNHFIQIKSKTGKRVDLYSTINEEQEVLFKPNTKFKITKMEINHAGNYEFELEELVE